MSMKSGTVPKEWKHARVIPLYKDGKCDEASNYRPISMLPIISKIMERIVHDQLYKVIEENNILNKWQSGFRPGYSTETAMRYVTDLLLTEMDSKKLTGVVFLNLKKAFDTVDHALLLTKLRNYGIRGDELSWVTSYLTDRTQSVSLENVTSDSMDISYGVPQGSILGPLLFTFYINDLSSVTKTCNVILYADDTAIIYSDKQKAQIEKHLNNDMEIVKTWLDENKLTLNVKKTKSMLIGNNKLLNEADYLDVRLYMDSIEQVGELKYLGVWLDQWRIVGSRGPGARNSVGPSATCLNWGSGAPEAPPPQRGPWQSPGGKAFWQQYIENWLKIRYLNWSLSTPNSDPIATL